MTTQDDTAGQADAERARLVDRLATAYYLFALAGAVAGQVWAGVKLLPWGDVLPVLVYGVLLLGAVGWETLAVAVAYHADHRRRLGERATAARVMSAVIAAAATGVIIYAHRDHLYLVLVFGTLSASAYALYLLQSGAKRRDALRVAGRLATVAPAYGVYRRVRHPILTARAAELARERGLGLYESLRAAELELRAERRRPAIAAAVEAAVRADQPDPRMAEIAVSTLDLDRIAAELADRADYAGWADRLAPAVTVPAEPTPEQPDPAEAELDAEQGAEQHLGSGRNSTSVPGGTAPRQRSGSDRNGSGGTRLRKAASRPAQRRLGSAPDGGTAADRIRALVAQSPELTRAELAARVGVSTRHVRNVLNGPGAEPTPEPGRLNGAG